MSKYNKTTAIKTTRSQYSDVYKFGDGYKYNSFDSSVDCWRESNAESYTNSVHHRSQNMICCAMGLMGFDEQDCFSAMASYINGSWVDHLNDMIKK